MMLNSLNIPSHPNKKQLAFGAIADDLTGAVELASILVRQGVRTELFVGVPTADTEADAAVVALKSRVAAPAAATEAFEQAGSWLEDHDPRQTFFKYCATFDSTPKGNIGCCTDVMLGQRGGGRTLFVPSFPENGRTVYGGHLFVGDQLVSESSKRFDPLTPMDNADLVSVLKAQTAHGVGLLPRRVLVQGSRAALAYLDERAGHGETYFIADAVDDDDLARLAELTLDWPLMTGGSTIVNHYPDLWRRRGWIDGSATSAGLPPVSGPAAVVAGSCSDRTLAQLAFFERAGNPVLWIDLKAGPAEAIMERARAWAAEHIGRTPFAIGTSADVDMVSAAQQAFGRDGAARLAEQILGEVSSMLVEMGVRRLMVAGGETSGAVLEALGVKQLQVGPYVPKGIALATAQTSDGPLGLCLKSGRIGADDVFLERLAAFTAGGVHA